MTKVTRQHGVGLIEVMVTVLLLSTSLLALAALQNRSLQFNQEAYFRSQANILAYDMIDRIRINAPNYSHYQIDFSDANPTGNSMAASDMREWRLSVANSLPGGTGAIECAAATRLCTVSVRWTETSEDGGSGEEGTDGNAQKPITFIYQTQI